MRALAIAVGSETARAAVGALGWVRVGGPDGDLIVVFSDAGIAAVAMASDARSDERTASDALPPHLRSYGLQHAATPPSGLIEALRSGDGSALAYDLRGASPFERAVWSATLGIPKGSVRTYGEIALAIGRPKAMRAVGNALGRNPIPILIPCHRVVRQSGDPGHYGLGDGMKRRLLEAEGVALRAAPNKRVVLAG